MGCEQQVRRVPKGILGGERLGIAHVERGTGKLAALERRDERAVIHKVAAPAVHEPGTGFAGLEEGSIGKLARGGAARQKARHHVGTGKRVRKLIHGVHGLENARIGERVALDALHMRAHGAAELGKMRADIARAEHEHVRAAERAHRPQIAPIVLALGLLIAGQALDEREEHGKHMLAHGLAVGADGAAELGAGGNGARGEIVVVAGTLQLQQLEVLCVAQQLRVHVAHDRVGSGNEFGQCDVGGIGVDDIRPRCACRKLGAMLVGCRQQAQDVHGGSSRFVFDRGHCLTKSPRRQGWPQARNIAAIRTCGNSACVGRFLGYCDAATVTRS